MEQKITTALILDHSGSPEASGQRAVDLSRRAINLRPGTVLGREWDPVEAREKLFKQSDSLTDLANLIELLEDKRDWEKLAIYGRKFFDRTHDLNSCRLLTHALYEIQDYESVVSILTAHGNFVDLSDSLLSLLAWSLYWTGDVKGATEALSRLQAKRDEMNDRISGKTLTMGGSGELRGSPEW